MEHLYTGDTWAIEKIYNEKMDQIEKMYYDFIEKNRRRAEKIYLDSVTYKKLEIGCASLRGKLLRDERMIPTIMGMTIEVLPTQEETVILGFDNIYDNMRLGFYAK